MWHNFRRSSRAINPRVGRLSVKMDRIRESPMPTKPSKELVAIPNPHPDRDYEVEFSTDEFTCVCPLTGQPDFANIRITFVPDETLVELKSLKLYLWSYRDEGAFHEDVTNRILNDLVDVLKPRRMVVVGEFNIRGGIGTVVKAAYPFVRTESPAAAGNGKGRSGGGR